MCARVAPSAAALRTRSRAQRARSALVRGPPELSRPARSQVCRHDPASQVTARARRTCSARRAEMEEHLSIALSLARPSR